MTTHCVNFDDPENLPPILRHLVDPTFRYTSHEHTVETNEDGSKEHTFTVVLTQDATEEPLGHLVSQISSTTTSERNLAATAASVYSSRSTRSPARQYVMMVHVKFILLHRDVFHRKVQSTFSDEFASDEPLHDVVNCFHQMCIRNLRLRHEDFHPRLSYCVGHLSSATSKAVQPSDMTKTIGQLSNGNYLDKLTIIIDNIN